MPESAFTPTVTGLNGPFVPVSKLSDRDKLKALLTELAIGFGEEGNDIVCTEGNDKVAGYHFFYTRFSFADDGSFIEMGAYE